MIHTTIKLRPIWRLRQCFLVYTVFVNPQFEDQTHYRPLPPVSLLSFVILHLKKLIKNSESFITFFLFLWNCILVSLWEYGIPILCSLPYNPQRASTLYLVPSTLTFSYPDCTAHDGCLFRWPKDRTSLSGYKTLYTRIYNIVKLMSFMLKWPVK